MERFLQLKIKNNNNNIENILCNIVHLNVAIREQEDCVKFYTEVYKVYMYM